MNFNNLPGHELIGKEVVYADYLFEIVHGVICYTRYSPMLEEGDLWVYIQDNVHLEFNDKEGEMEDGSRFMYAELRRLSEVDIIQDSVDTLDLANEAEYF